jgi:hypothetical protein
MEWSATAVHRLGEMDSTMEEKDQKIANLEKALAESRAAQQTTQSKTEQFMELMNKMNSKMENLEVESQKQKKIKLEAKHDYVGTANNGESGSPKGRMVSPEGSDLETGVSPGDPHDLDRDRGGKGNETVKVKVKKETENKIENEIENEKENISSKKHIMDVAQVDRLHRPKLQSAADHKNWNKGFISALHGMLHLLNFWDADTGQVFNAAKSADCETIARLAKSKINVDCSRQQLSECSAALVAALLTVLLTTIHNTVREKHVVWTTWWTIHLRQLQC